jgi:hypothetical protein
MKIKPTVAPSQPKPTLRERIDANCKATGDWQGRTPEELRMRREVVELEKSRETEKSGEPKCGVRCPDDLSLCCLLSLNHQPEYHSDYETDWLTSKPEPLAEPKLEELPELDVTDEDREEAKRRSIGGKLVGAAFVCRERQLLLLQKENVALRGERDKLKDELDFMYRETMNFQINAGHRARQLANELAGYDTVRAEAAEAQLASEVANLEANAGRQGTRT